MLKKLEKMQRDRDYYRKGFLKKQDELNQAKVQIQNFQEELTRTLEMKTVLEESIQGQREEFENVVPHLKDEIERLKANAEQLGYNLDEASHEREIFEQLKVEVCSLQESLIQKEAMFA